MAAVKPFYYKPHDKIKGLCVGLDIAAYTKRLRFEFNGAALSSLDPDTPLPEGPVYYSDAPRKLYEGYGKNGLLDAVTYCLRERDNDGEAKRVLAEKIAKRAAQDENFRQKIFSYQRVPQSWADHFLPADPSDAFDVEGFQAALNGLADRDYRTPNNAKGPHHPLARIMESKSFSDEDRLRFVRDFLVGKERKKEASWGVRFGTQKDFEEYNVTRWLEQNNALILKTVGDVVSLRSAFTATNRIRKGQSPDLENVEPGYFKALRKGTLQSDASNAVAPSPK